MAASSNNHPLVTSLRDEVICTTCLSLPRVGMFQCENGHLICKDCIGRCSNVCPTCKKPMGKIRSIIADKILSLLPLPCRHCDHGCPTELYQGELNAHELTCSYRPICCVDIACNAKVPFCKMIDHMSKDHEAGDFVHANGSKYQSYFIVNDDDFSREIMWISDHLSLDGLHFFRECCRSAEGQWHVWVYLLGTPAEAAAYRATVRIFLPGGGGAGTAAGAADEEEMAYRGRVNALNSPARERPDEVAGLTFPDFVAKRFWKNKQIHYDVAVERRQPLYAAAPASRKERSSAGGGKERSGKSSSSSAKSTSGLVKGEADCSAGKTEQGSTREGADGEETAQAAQLAQAAKGGEEGGKTRKKKSASTGGGQGKDANGKEGNGKKEDVKETSC